ncbi:MAG: MFS transporter [Bacteroidota bacterium]
MSETKTFTPYQIFIIAVLALLQFTVILDFMVLSPLGAQLLAELNINTQKFGFAVSAYAFSAGASGLLAAGFADRFDRKRLLLFFYAGFIVGTLLCGLAPNYHLLLAARIITGIFGGVIGSVIFAIISDLFPMQVRGRVMGFVQMAFAVSQILGLPIGLYLANLWGWHAPFLMIVGLGIPFFILIWLKMEPVDGHIHLQQPNSPFRHLFETVSKPIYLQGFTATILLSTGGFMLMPFGSAYAVHNLGITMEHLPIVYLVTGISSLIAGPLLGRLVDKVGKYPVFVGGTLLTTVMVFVYTNLGITPLWVIVTLNAVLFVGITSRMISASALMSAVPDPADRGAYMGVNSSIAQISGGFASAIAGMIVYQNESGFLEHYPILGYVVCGSMIITIFMIGMINKIVQRKMAAAALVAVP